MVSNFSQADRPALSSERASEGQFAARQDAGLSNEAAMVLSNPGLASDFKNYGSLAANQAEMPAGSRRSQEVYDILRPVTLEDLKPIEPGRLDSNCSLNELANNGVIADRIVPFAESKESRLAKLSQSVASGGTQIIDQNADRVFVTGADPSIKPDLLIRKDGTVEMYHNPERPPYIIQFESDRNTNVQRVSTQAEQNDGYGSQNNSARGIAEVPIQDSSSQATDAQMLAASELSNWLQAREKNAIDKRQSQAEATDRQISEINSRFNQDGSMSAQEANDYFPQKDAAKQREAQPKESTDLASVLDMLACMSNPDKKDPYDTVRQTENGFAIGRYGLNADIFMDWLRAQPDFAEAMGNPPDMSKLPHLMAKLAEFGKIPADFADKFKNPEFTKGFLSCLEKMADGKIAPSASEIEKYFPSGVQEAAMKGIATEAGASGVRAEYLALALQLGKSIGKLDRDDLNKARNQSFMNASLEVLGLALAKNQAGPQDRIDWKHISTPSAEGSAQADRRQHKFNNADKKNPAAEKKRQQGDDRSCSALAFSIANAAESNARRTDTVGWCYKEVANTLDRFGIHLSGISAYMAAPQLAKNKHFEEVSTTNLKKGTVLVFGPTHDHPHGHITVYLGGGREASDHVQSLVNFNKYSGVRAFEPIA